MTPDSFVPPGKSTGASKLDRIAGQIFRLMIMFWVLRHKNRTTDPYDMTEAEFIALDTLTRQGTCTVGQLQKVLDVQPAQMSRIIRSLESKGSRGAVSCALNPKDKRRIDVSITAAGRRVLNDYRNRRLQASKRLLVDLTNNEQDELVKLLDRFDAIMSNRLGASSKE